jgi:hypothetical protein
MRHRANVFPFFTLASVRAHGDTIFLVLFLTVIGALLIVQALRHETKLVAIEDKVPVAVPDKAPVADKPDDAGPRAGGSVGKPALTPDCEKELRRTADLLRFFANRIQGGEDTQSVVTDMRQQEKKLSAVCANDPLKGPH